MFSKQSILNFFSRNRAGLVLGSVGLIDAKGINVAQQSTDMVVRLSDIRPKTDKNTNALGKFFVL